MGKDFLLVHIRWSIDRYSADILTLLCHGGFAVRRNLRETSAFTPPPNGMCGGVEDAAVQVMIRKKT
jgi:hypothetical protein